MSLVFTRTDQKAGTERWDGGIAPAGEESPAWNHPKAIFWDLVMKVTLLVMGVMLT